MLDDFIAIGHLGGAIVFARGEFALHENVCAFGQTRSELREALPVGNNRVPLRFAFPLAFVVLPRARGRDRELGDGCSVR